MPVVIVPEMVTVPVVILITSFLDDVVEAIVKVPQLSTPSFTLMLHVKPDEGRGIEISPLTVSELEVLKFKLLVAATAAKVIDEHWAPEILTVTVMPLLIVTASAEVGTAEPPQVAVLLQFPLTEAVLAAPCTKVVDNINTNKNAKANTDALDFSNNKLYFFLINA